MTNEEFSAKVAELEVLARRDPDGYRARTVLLALLGYAYLGAILLVVSVTTLLALVSIVYLKFAGLKLFIVLAAFLGVMFKAIWVKLPKPEGIELSRQDAPELFAMIDELRAALRAPAFHRVLVTSDFNAAVAHVPRFGVFGGRVSYLILGLPLLKSLTVPQFKAVLAHEFGHQARGDAVVASWIYGQRLRWARLMGVLEQAESRGTFLFRRFIRWYSPYFNAYSFPLARAAEYQADAAAARLTSPRDMADALTGIGVVSRFLAAEFWPGIHRQADTEPQPVAAPFVGFTQSVAHGLGDGGNIMAGVLGEETTLDDTHPALKDRLAAIGQAPRVALPAPGETADRLLGTRLEEITTALDEQWKREILPSWKQRHDEVQQQRSSLAQLTAKAATPEGLTPDEACARANLLAGVGGDADGAMALLKELHERVPDHARTCFFLGLALTGRDDDDGTALIERAMALDESAIYDGAMVLRDYHLRRGREPEARTWHERLLQRAAELQGAAKERETVTTKDKFDRHGLDEADLTALVQQLRAVPELRKAFLVRKRLTFLVHRPLFVLGFKATRQLGLFREKVREERVMYALQHKVSFPGEAFIVCLEGDNYWLDRKLRFMRGTRLV